MGAGPHIGIGAARETAVASDRGGAAPPCKFQLLQLEELVRRHQALTVVWREEPRAGNRRRGFGVPQEDQQFAAPGPVGRWRRSSCGADLRQPAPDRRQPRRDRVAVREQRPLGGLTCPLGLQGPRLTGGQQRQPGERDADEDRHAKPEREHARRRRSRSPGPQSHSKRRHHIGAASWLCHGKNEGLFAEPSFIPYCRPSLP